MRFLSVVIFHVILRQLAADSRNVEKVRPADDDNDDAVSPNVYNTLAPTCYRFAALFSSTIVCTQNVAYILNDLPPQ